MESAWIQHLVDGLEPHLPPELAQVVIAVAVVLAGYLLARLARFVVARLFRRVATRLASLSVRASERAGMPASAEIAAQGEAATTDVAGRVVFWLVFAVFAGAATALLGFPVLSSWLVSLAGYLPRILAAAAIVFLGVISGLLLRMVVVAAVSRSSFTLARSLGRATQIAVVGLAATVAIEVLGIEITFLVVVAAIVLGALLGGASLAFALGARESVSNLLASHYMAKWYRVGQRVKVGPHQGRIVEILPGAVVLETSGGQLYIPAAVFAAEPSLRIADEAGD
jgi:hypothetical protein